MIGAIIGDICGSMWEGTSGPGVRKDFPLLLGGNRFTDDTVMTIAIADAMMKMPAKVGIDPVPDFHRKLGEETWMTQKIKEVFAQSMREWGVKYENAGYGGSFYNWLHNPEMGPYRSYGNGSAMRVSPVGWIFDDLDDTLEVAKLTAKVTHDHPEGIFGAMAVAGAIWLARMGHEKDYILDFIQERMRYGHDRPLHPIQATMSVVDIKKQMEGQFAVDCMRTIPIAVACFMEADSFTETIQNAIYIGGDTDTNAAIAGSIAEAYYKAKGQDQDIAKWEALVFGKLPGEMQEVINEFYQAVEE